MRTTRRALIIVVAAASAALAGCGLLPDRLMGRSMSVAPAPGQVEPLHAAAVANDQAVFWVSSNGCTVKDDLIPVVQQRVGRAIITLRRVKPDDCTSPQIGGVELVWTFDELGLKPGQAVSVENPYQLPPS